jgi:hypothetical protein
MQHRQIKSEEAQPLLQPPGALTTNDKQQSKALGYANSLGDGQTQGGTGQIAPVLFTCRGRELR